MYMIDTWFNDYVGIDGDPRFCDINGTPVKHTPFTDPYSYDSYVIWKSPDFEEADCCVYHDRMMSWNWDKFAEACHRVWGNGGQMFHNRHPKDIEKFLSLYFDKDVELTLVMQGCNVSNGYPYWVFGYKEKGDSK